MAVKIWIVVVWIMMAFSSVTQVVTGVSDESMATIFRAFLNLITTGIWILVLWVMT
jgi:hypothetical protein